MKNRLRKVGQTIFLSPYFLLLVLAIGAFRPILGNRAPIADDYGYHVLRLAQLRHLVEQGVLFSRWMPDLAQGYGYPLFNYFAPLSYYLTLPFIFITDNVATGFQLTLAVGIILSGWTMYLFMRDHVRPAAAIVAAVAYMYAPYYSYDVLFRANIGEAMGFFWMPLALWGMGRVVNKEPLTPRPLPLGEGAWFPLLRERARVRGFYPYIAITAIAYAAIILTHNVFALIFSPLLGLYGLLCLINNSQFTIHHSPFSSEKTTDDGQQTTHKSKLHHILSPLLPVSLSLFLGLTLSSFFWLPAIYEQSKAAFDRLYGNPAYIYSNNFLTVIELFSGAGSVPTDLINPSPPPSLGLNFLLIALLSLPLNWRSGRHNRPKIIFFTLITLLIIFLVLPISAPLWQLLPLLQIIQFPWRLLAIGALTVAVLCGFSAETIYHPITLSPRHPLLVSLPPCLFVSLLILTAQLFLSPAYTNKSDKTINDIIPWENATQTLGTTVAGEYLPNTVREIPYGKPQHIIADPIGYIAERHSEPLRHTMTLQTDSAQTITVNQFAFDGWRAYVNDQPVPITPSDPNGLITFPVESGINNLRVEFRETPFRLTLDILSAASLLLCVGLLIRGRQQRRSFRGTSLLSTAPHLAVPLIAIGLISGFLLPAIRPQHLNADLALKQPGNVQPITFTNGMELLGGSVDETVQADQPIPITLFWRVQQTPATSYESTVALRDKNGAFYSAKAPTIPPRTRLAYATNAWRPDQYAQQQVLVEPIAGTPPGDYELVVTVFEKDTLRPIPQQNSTQTQPPVATITLDAPAHSANLTPQNILDLTIDEGVQIFGYEQDRTAAKPGDVVLLTLFWQLDSPLAVTPSIFLDDKPLPASAAYSFAAGRYQTRHLIRVPRDLASGDAMWQVAGADGRHAFGTIMIDAPARIMQPPDVTEVLNAPAGFAALYGYEIVQNGETQTVRLVWQANVETDTSYRAFVHLLDENDEIVAQSDAEPAGWTRPTTGWIVGEYVVDEHVLDSEPVEGNATSLRIGFYNPETGERAAEPIKISLPDQSD